MSNFEEQLISELNSMEPEEAYNFATGYLYAGITKMMERLQTLYLSDVPLFVDPSELAPLLLRSSIDAIMKWHKSNIEELKRNYNHDRQ